jgi:hypothetical protein
MSPVRYELGFYIPEDVILHSYYREDLTTIFLTVTTYSSETAHVS